MYSSDVEQRAEDCLAQALPPVLARNRDLVDPQLWRFVRARHRCSVF
jgi:hypothetical protein